MHAHTLKLALWAADGLLTNTNVLLLQPCLGWARLSADLAAPDSAALTLYILTLLTAPITPPSCKQCQDDHSDCTAERVCQSMSKGMQLQVVLPPALWRGSLHGQAEARAQAAAPAAQHWMPGVSALPAGTSQLPHPACAGAAPPGTGGGACGGGASSAAWSDTTVPTLWTGPMRPAILQLSRWAGQLLLQSCVLTAQKGSCAGAAHRRAGTTCRCRITLPAWLAVGEAAPS